MGSILDLYEKQNFCSITSASSYHRVALWRQRPKLYIAAHRLRSPGVVATFQDSQGVSYNFDMLQFGSAIGCWQLLLSTEATLIRWATYSFLSWSEHKQASCDSSGVTTLQCNGATQRMLLASDHPRCKCEIKLLYALALSRDDQSSLHLAWATVKPTLSPSQFAPDGKLHMEWQLGPPSLLSVGPDHLAQWLLWAASSGCRPRYMPFWYLLLHQTTALRMDRPAVCTQSRQHPTVNDQ